MNDLFKEACEMDIVPVNIRNLLTCGERYCQKYGLDWCLSAGEKEGFFCYSITPDDESWIISVENENISDAIVTAIATSWSNMYADRIKYSKVINIEDWRKIL